MRDIGRILTAVLVAALSGIGCASQNRGSGTTPGETSPPAGSAATTPSPAPGSASPGASSPSAAPGRVTNLKMFFSPSRNIVCAIADEGEVRCDISDRSFSPPPKPRDCEFDWGSSLIVDSEGASFACVSDSIYDERHAVLAYGETSRVGMIECVSREEGLTCTHLGNRHGFFLSKARYQLF